MLKTVLQTAAVVLTAYTVQYAVKKVARTAVISDIAKKRGVPFEVVDLEFKEKMLAAGSL